MIQSIRPAPALAILPTLALPVAALADGQRRCDTRTAIFPDGLRQPATFRISVAVKAKAARVRVDGSGEWGGRRIRHASGVETIRFDSGAAMETPTIGTRGELLWEIACKEQRAADKRVIAFVGDCQPWRAQ